MILYQNAIRALSRCFHMQIMLQHIEVRWAHQEFFKKKKKSARGTSFIRNNKIPIPWDSPVF